MERLSFDADAAFTPREDQLEGVTIAPLTASLAAGAPLQAAIAAGQAGLRPRTLNSNSAAAPSPSSRGRGAARTAAMSRRITSRGECGGARKMLWKHLVADTSGRDMPRR